MRIIFIQGRKVICSRGKQALEIDDSLVSPYYDGPDVTFVKSIWFFPKNKNSYEGNMLHCKEKVDLQTLPELQLNKFFFFSRRDTSLNLYNETCLKRTICFNTEVRFIAKLHSQNNTLFFSVFVNEIICIKKITSGPSYLTLYDTHISNTVLNK